MGEQGISGHEGAGADQIKLGRGEGEKPYRVVEQGLGRIERRLRSIFSVFADSGGDAEKATQVDAAILHDALSAFIPDLMPEHEFRGLKSADALERLKNEGPDAVTDEDFTNTDPSLPQLMNAVETIYTVNGGDRLVRFLGKFVDPDQLRKRIRYEIATRGVDSDGSPSSPPQNGASASTPSGTTDPDPSQTAPSVSPSPGS